MLMVKRGVSIGFLVGLLAMAGIGSTTVCADDVDIYYPDQSDLQRCEKNNDSLIANTPPMLTNPILPRGGDKVIYGLFKPESKDPWRGNVKQYRLDVDNLDVLGPHQRSLMSNSGKKHSDDRLDFTVRDFWSSTFSSLPSDSIGVASGGVASQIIKGANRSCVGSGRPFYTYLGGYHQPSNQRLPLRSSYQSEATLASSQYCIRQDEVFDSALKRLFKQKGWGQRLAQQGALAAQLERGVQGLLQEGMGGVLHSQPLVVDYGHANQSLFVSTQQGVLHAFDVETGKELFAFMPQELLPRLLTIGDGDGDGEGLEKTRHSKNDVPVDLSPEHPHFYGLDGSWTAWRHDAWKLESSDEMEGNDLKGGEAEPVYRQDGVIDPSKNRHDHVYLYGGMRRGGSNYYALDVTSIHSAHASRRVNIEPTLKFVIKGGEAAGKRSPYYRLGQTWSTPTLAQIRWGKGVKTVIVFGGGYDPEVYDQEARRAGQSSARGNQVYVVDAETGELLWWVSGVGSGADVEAAEMRDSIPAKIKTMDLNGNGLLDRLYFGTLGGQLFRVDIEDTLDLATPVTAKNFASVSLLAELGGNGSEARRFFNAPSVAVVEAKVAGLQREPQVGAGETVKETVREPLKRSLREPLKVAIAILSGDKSAPKSSHIKEKLFVIYDGIYDDAYDDISVSKQDLGQKSDRSKPITINDLVALGSLGGGGTSRQGQRDRRLDQTAYRGWVMSLGSESNSVGEKSMGSPLFFEGNLFFTTYIPSRSPLSSFASCSGKRSGIGRSRLYVIDGVSGAGRMNRLLFDRQAGVGASASDLSAGRYIDHIADGMVPNLSVVLKREAVLLMVGDKIGLLRGQSNRAVGIGSPSGESKGLMANNTFRRVSWQKIQ